METRYRDLGEIGLPLIVPGDPDFDELVEEIQNRPEPFDSWRAGDVSRAAVLLNQTGRAIVTLAYRWKYTTRSGGTSSHAFSNLGSSMQIDVLCGRSNVVRDLGSFILPASKRLITERGMFGTNLDVLGAEELPRGGGYRGAGGSGSRVEEEIETAELMLDSVVLEDGLCAGPDEGGLIESLAEDVERQRNVAGEIVEEVERGAGAGEIFEILRPLAKHGLPHRTGHTAVLAMFANMSINKLVNEERGDWREWFEGIAKATPLRLHRDSGSPGGLPY